MLKYLLLTIFLTVNFVVVGDAQTLSLNRKKLIGVWKINLQLEQDVSKDIPDLEITKLDARKFSGTFFGSEIQNTDMCDCAYEGKKTVLFIAFTTEVDGVLKSHFARFVGDELEGVTHTIGGSVLPWRAEKSNKDKSPR